MPRRAAGDVRVKNVLPRSIRARSQGQVFSCPFGSCSSLRGCLLCCAGGGFLGGARGGLGRDPFGLSNTGGFRLTQGFQLLGGTGLFLSGALRGFSPSLFLSGNGRRFAGRAFLGLFLCATSCGLLLCGSRCGLLLCETGVSSRFSLGLFLCGALRRFAGRLLLSGPLGRLPCGLLLCATGSGFLSGCCARRPRPPASDG
jgi:hypothetical protein